MRQHSMSLPALFALFAVVSVITAGAASAKCTRLAFSVNDYGKDGPTKDAKQLLDKYIAKWTSDRGIKKYTTGAKKVNCELYLNLIVVDEHTCRAEADVCWAGKDIPPVIVKKANDPAEKSAVTEKTPAGEGPAAKATEKNETKPPVAKSDVDTAPTKPAKAPAPEQANTEPKPAAAKAESAKPTPKETGSVAPPKPAVEPAVVDAPPPPVREPYERDYGGAQ